MSKEIQIGQAINNAEENISFLATLPDSALAEKLDTVHLQMQLAEQNKNTAALQLLEIWRSQIIAARIYKAENNIADAPSEIDLAIAAIETFEEKAEERKEALSDFSKEKEPETEPVSKPKGNDGEQLTLF